MYIKLLFTILPFVTCAALIRMKSHVSDHVLHTDWKETVAYEGTTLTAIGEAPDLVCEREPNDEHDWYAVAVIVA